jgi:hypothetical protein
MITPTVSKLINKLAWTARRFGRSAPIDVLYQGGSKDHPEYIKRIRGPVYLEPLHGYAITADGVLVEETMDPHYYIQVPTATWRNGLPSMLWFERTVHRQNLIDHHRSVVSLRHQWEWNYYHFHLDVLGKMKLLSEYGVLDGRPLALGRYVREFPFAAEVLRKGKLSKRDWLIPDTDNRRIILADELIYCRIDGHAAGDRVRYLLNQMELPPPPLNSRKKIFLNREPPATRVASNFSEIRPLIEERGFTIVDSAKLSMDEKIELFSNIRYLVAIHGAGLTNVIYRRDAPLSLIEIHGSSYIPPDIKIISHDFGYTYRRLSCEPAKGVDPQHASIYVDPTELCRAMDELLQT